MDAASYPPSSRREIDDIAGRSAAMPSNETRPSSVGPRSSLPFGVFAPAMEYMVDAAQRSVLFWDTLRQRGDQYRAHQDETAPHVLDYKVELLVDGRTLPRPVKIESA